MTLPYLRYKLYLPRHRWISDAPQEILFESVDALRKFVRSNVRATATLYDAERGKRGRITSSGVIRWNKGARDV